VNSFPPTPATATREMPAMPIQSVGFTPAISTAYSRPSAVLSVTSKRSPTGSYAMPLTKKLLASSPNTGNLPPNEM